MPHIATVYILNHEIRTKAQRSQKLQLDISIIVSILVIQIRMIGIRNKWIMWSNRDSVLHCRVVGTGILPHTFITCIGWL